MKFKTIMLLVVICVLASVTYASGELEDRIRTMMTAVNADLDTMGANFQLESVDYSTESGEGGQTVFLQ
ncbi:MAG: hypothetical protein KAS23_17170 [Anaerohalosphaera sp.]|nr:hypothetical protein [Anaerohalosphaera sp.]